RRPAGPGLRPGDHHSSVFEFGPRPHPAPAHRWRSGPPRHERGLADPPPPDRGPSPLTPGLPPSPPTCSSGRSLNATRCARVSFPAGFRNVSRSETPVGAGGLAQDLGQEFTQAGRGRPEVEPVGPFEADAEGFDRLLAKVVVLPAAGRVELVTVVLQPEAPLAPEEVDPAQDPALPVPDDVLALRGREPPPPEQAQDVGGLDAPGRCAPGIGGQRFGEAGATLDR